MSVEYALMLVLVTGVLVTGLGVSVREWFGSFLCPFEAQLGLGSSCAADGTLKPDPPAVVQPTGAPSSPATDPTTVPSCDETSSTSDTATTSSGDPGSSDATSDCETSSSTVTAGTPTTP
jgi:hypothetical protein